MLRVGIMLESRILCAWMAGILSEIRSGEFARVEAVILSPTASERSPSFLFTLYERWDYQRNQVTHDALAPVDLSPALSGIPWFSVDPASGSISEDQRATIQDLHLDVLLQFTSSTPRNLADAARFGVWSFHFDDENDDGNGAALFWRVFNRDPVSPCSLLISSGTEGRTAYKGEAATDPASLYRTRNPVYWKIAEAALRALQALHLGGAGIHGVFAAAQHRFPGWSPP